MSNSEIIESNSDSNGYKKKRKEIRTQMMHIKFMDSNVS